MLAKGLPTQRPKGMKMADQGDMTAHEQTYAGVISLLKWGAVGCFVVAAVVVWLIS